MKLHQVGNRKVLFGVFAVAVGFLDDFSELRQITIKAAALYAENFIFAAEKCGRAEKLTKACNNGVVRIVVDPRIAIVGEVFFFFNKTSQFASAYVAKSDESLNTEQLLPRKRSLQIRR